MLPCLAARDPLPDLQLSLHSTLFALGHGSWLPADLSVTPLPPFSGSTEQVTAENAKWMHRGLCSRARSQVTPTPRSGTRNSTPQQKCAPEPWFSPTPAYLCTQSRVRYAPNPATFQRRRLGNPDRVSLDGPGRRWKGQQFSERPPRQPRPIGRTSFRAFRRPTDCLFNAIVHPRPRHL